MKRLFITATGTDVGKTLLVTALCWQLKQARKTVTALKPVITGYSPKDPNSDTALILKSCGLKSEPAMMETISPWRFEAPLAPNLAAAREKVTLTMDAVAKFCREHASLNSDALLVEGAGGVMAPLSDEHTMLDLAVALGWPVVLVGGNYLGAISHTLTAHAVLVSRGLQIAALVISESPMSPVSMMDTVTTLEKFLPKTFPIVKLPRIPATEELWKHVPSVSWIAT